MTAPSGTDVDAMARIMQAMNGTGPSLNQAPLMPIPGQAANAVPAAGAHVNPINDMKSLIMAMNEGVSLDDAPVYQAPTPSVRETISSGPHVDPAVNAMAKILDMFKTDDPVAGLQDRAITDPRLREAMVTEATANGVRVGSWEIQTDDINGLKSYSVSNVHTGEPIASDLTLYDAAKGLASALNEGMTINTPTVRKLLNAEGAYARARQNAAEHRQSMMVAETKQRKMVAEDRFNDALAKAKEARAMVTKLVG